jgi:hypothetical protein
MTKPKFDQAFWEQLWSKTLREHADKVARRPPNAHLMAEVANLPPGRALDAEGGVMSVKGSCLCGGATLPTFFRDHPGYIGLPLGTLDDDPGVRPSAHVFVDSKAPWFEITDSLPQFSEKLVKPAER